MKSMRCQMGLGDGNDGLFFIHIQFVKNEGVKRLAKIIPNGVIYTGRYKNKLEVYYTVNFVTMILKTFAKDDKNGQFWIFAQFCTHATACAQHDGGGNRGFCGNYGFIVFTGRFSAHLVDGIVWCQLFDSVCAA